MAEFLRVLKISKNSRIEAPLLQYLSIMIQNIESDHAICKILLVLELNYMLYFWGICSPPPFTILSYLI